MLNRKKFLEKLGISPNWSINYPWHLSNCCDADIKNKDLTLCSPDMLCDMVENNLAYTRIVNLHSCPELEDLTMPMFEQNYKTIERATGRSWEEVRTIAEECQE